MSSLISIGTAVPKYSYPQMQLVDKMLEFHGWNNAAQKRKLRALYKSTAITKRHSVIPDFSLNGEMPRLFTPETEQTDPPIVTERLSVFKKEAYPLAEESIRSALIQSDLKPGDITHIITVSCTGLTAPGLELEIIEKMEFPDNIRRFGVNFMGCYAVFHALQIADAICCSDEDARILIVSVELCTLHFQAKDTPDTILANALFADGSSAAVVTSDAVASDFTETGLHLDGFASQVLHHGKDEMAWKISPHGFLMTLSSAIPDLVEQNVKSLLEEVVEANGLSSKSITRWAIHPGGKKILSAVQKALELSVGDLIPSYRILSEYGNMSSATILFVLQEMLENHLNRTTRERIFVGGFGPGLTLETALFSTGEK